MTPDIRFSWDDPDRKPDRKKTHERQKTPRVIVITGASAGLGRAIAQAFARTKGAQIGLIARGKDGLEGAKDDVENLAAGQ